MNTTTHDAAPLSTAPFPREDARSIARAFLPKHVLGNRYDYYYTLTKLRTDPLYPGVLDALRGIDAPLLDLGCGLGLLAHALRFDGQTLAYRGVDNDAAKIARARRDVANYLRGQVQEARWLIKSLKTRAETMLKVAQAIVRAQAAFLEFGAEAMRPLVLRDVAEEIGMHESTVSRVVSNKWMATPRGLLPMKFFFHSAISSAAYLASEADGPLLVFAMTSATRDAVTLPRRSACHSGVP